MDGFAVSFGGWVPRVTNFARAFRSWTPAIVTAQVGLVSAAVICGLESAPVQRGLG